MNPAIVLQFFALVCSTTAIIYYLLAVKARHSRYYDNDTIGRSESLRFKTWGKIFAIIAIISLLISYSIIFVQIRNGRHVDADVKDIIHSAIVLLPMSLIELVVDELIS